MDPNILTITLPVAIGADGGAIAALTLREPTAKQVMEAEKLLTGSGVVAYRAYLMALIEAVSGVKNETLNLVPITVTREAAQWLAGFIATNVVAPDKPAAELTVTFAPAIVSAGVTYDAVTLREPTTGQVRAAEMAMNGDTGPAASRHYEISLVSRVGGIPYVVACDLPVSACNQAAAYCRGFIAGGSPITPS